MDDATRVLDEKGVEPLSQLSSGHLLALQIIDVSLPMEDIEKHLNSNDFVSQCMESLFLNFDHVNSSRQGDE
ncbi:unnamed protein product [Rhodiola kirilowii]